LGLSVGTFSFDKTQGLRTATEVISEQSDTYRFVRLQQEPLNKMIRDTIKSIIELSITYEVEYEKDGKIYKISDLVENGYNVNVVFDDSIIQDKSSEKTDGVMLVQNNLMSKKTFYIDVMHWTPERAELELQRLAEEQKQAPAQQIDWSGIE